MTADSADLIHRAFPKIPAAGERCGRPESVPSPNGRWVALEKIHGAQLMVVATADAVRPGKRKQFLADDESFFGWQTVRADLLAAGRAAFNALWPEVGGVVPAGASVTLYGELFGGRYPHPDVAVVPGLRAVQTGVWYAPGLHWAVFDVLVADAAGASGEFLAWHEVDELATRIGLLTPPLVACGTRAEVDATSERFVTRVPQLLGLPALPDEDSRNVAEGLVVRPDARGVPANRVIHKRKIAEFDEWQFDGAQPFDPGQRLDAAALRELAGRMLNATRIASAQSRCGDDNPRATIDEAVLDVLIDLTDALPVAMAGLAEDAEAELREMLRCRAADLLDIASPKQSGEAVARG